LEAKTTRTKEPLLATAVAALITTVVPAHLAAYVLLKY